MIDLLGKSFWDEMANLVVSRQIVIDRPCGKGHPRFPEYIYPFDYGYVEGTLAADGDGIDVWIGSQSDRSLTGILCTYDTVDRDAEIKLLLGCNEADVEIILDFMPDYMRYLYIPNTKEHK